LRCGDLAGKGLPEARNVDAHDLHYDYVICGSTPHHFTEDQTCTLLRLMNKKRINHFVVTIHHEGPRCTTGSLTGRPWSKSG